ncbi:DUF4202 domain-containing protein [Pleomorphovibrio marinus]|uniref:DUF4202 domain-containing protein n=1 Tax=Pleomorphovibrio marinus TaxID=2164132 RepID=UPI000E0B35AF|nr:DUF4202 domain-containing protein [Pleomorphovibrio marinus]
MTSSSNRFEKTIEAIDSLNSLDPHLEESNGSQIPKELLYSQRMTETLNQYEPSASETLKIAARAQHIQRWKIPRESYPMDRKGYLLWRTELKKFHGKLTADIMAKHAYSEAEIKKVEDLINKRRLKTDPEVQTLEDVICLVFLRYYFDEFIQKHEEEQEKIVEIIHKTWKKMSPEGQEAALKLPHSPKALELVSEAIDE